MPSVKAFLSALQVKKCPNCGQQIPLFDAIPIDRKKPNLRWYEFELYEQRSPRECPSCRLMIDWSRSTYVIGILSITILSIWMAIKPIGIYYSNISGVFIAVFLLYFFLRTGRIILSREQDIKADHEDGDRKA